MGEDRMTVEQIIQLETGQTDFCAGTRIQELVKDSLEFLSLLGAIESELDIKFNHASRFETVGDLLDAVNVSARVC